MKRKSSWLTFWALVGVFVIVICVYLIPMARESLLGPALLLGSGAAFLLLGAALIYFTIKEKVRGWVKRFLLITGASAVGIPISVVLHNVIYGLFIHFFGADFWDRVGLSDEPVFFVIAVFICPVAFLIGTIGSIVLRVKR